MTSEWTIDTLKEHFDTLRQQDLIALHKAEVTLGRRLESMNEVRDQLREQANSFLPRETYDTTVSEWASWRRRVDDYMAAGSGRSEGISATGRLLATAIGLGTTLIIVAIAIANLATR